MRELASVPSPTLTAMFEASLVAFWEVARRQRWTMTEQASLLAISARSCRRWRQSPPDLDVNVLDRLQLILLSYECVSDLAPDDEEEKARIFRDPGGAEDPAHPPLTLLAGLSSPSLLEMDTHYRRLAEFVHRRVR